MALDAPLRRGRSPSGGLHPEITLPHAQEWELYHNGFSLCSKKLRVCLAELGLPYASHRVHLIETGAYENVRPAHLRVHPAGLVPVLVHEGHPVYESHDQIVHAARHAGERGRALLPEDAETRARVERWIDCASLVGDDPLQGTGIRAGHCVPGLTLPIFATMLQYIPWRRFAEGFLRHPDKRRPFALAALKARGVRGIPKLPPAIALLRRSRRHMERHLDAVAEELEKHGGPWLAGRAFTLADVSWVVVLDRLVEADWEAHFWGDGRRPAVAAWWQRLRERPSYRDAIEAQRCPITRQGMADLKAAKATEPRLREALEGRQGGVVREAGS